MARTVAEIKDAIVAVFMGAELAQQEWGFPAGSRFEDYFKTTSIESILFDINAISMNDLEQLFDAHSELVNELLFNRLTHTERWYQTKVLDFQKDMLLVQDKDCYDNSALTETEIADSKVVKYSAVESSADSSELTIKIAGENGGVKEPLDSATETQVAEFLAQVKDAGVRIRLVNSTGDYLGYSVDIYYDALLYPTDVRESVKNAADFYLNNLPFNGDFTNMALVDAIQAVAGVKVVEHKFSAVQEADGTLIEYVNARYKPISGYFNAGVSEINMIAYEL